MKNSRFELFLQVCFALLSGMACVFAVLFSFWKLPLPPVCLFLAGAVSLTLGGKCLFETVKTKVQKLE